MCVNTSTTNITIGYFLYFCRHHRCRIFVSKSQRTLCIIVAFASCSLNEASYRHSRCRPVASTRRPIGGKPPSSTQNLPMTTFVWTYPTKNACFLQIFKMLLHIPWRNSNLLRDRSRSRPRILPYDFYDTPTHRR